MGTVDWTSAGTNKSIVHYSCVLPSKDITQLISLLREFLDLVEISSKVRNSSWISHFSVCSLWRKICSSYHKNFNYRYNCTRFRTMLPNALVRCRIVACRRHCYVRLETEFDLKIYRNVMLKYFVWQRSSEHLDPKNLSKKWDNEKKRINDTFWK